MKKITKKIISMLVSTVMAVTSLSMSFASTFAEDMNDVNSTGTNAALDVKSGGLLGELIPDQINEVSNENQEKRQKEYAIYKMEYDVSMTNLIVSYSAKTNCTIFVGFYNDEGTQLFTSVTEALPAGTDVTAVIEKPDDLPEYYLIKAFMIGQANEPLTESFAEKKFTKAVQEIINKDASEFDQDKVIKFDDYNFIVSKNEYEKIESNENSDTLVEQFDDDTYLFTNINKIKDLKKGQIVLFDFSNKMLLFEISDISITDSTALIKKKESDTDELISFMKFDSSKADKKADISYTPNGEDDVEFEIVENNSKSHSDVNGDRKPFPSFFSVFDKVTFNPCIKFPLKKVSSSDESDIDLGIEGYIEIGAEIELEAYYEDKTEYVKGSFTLYTDFASEGEAELSVNLGYAYFTFFKLFDITFSPKLNVKLGGNFKFRLSRTWDFGDAATAEERIPHNEKGFEGSFEIDVYIITEIKASLLFSDLFSLSIEPEIGIKHEFTSTDARNNEYVHHDCESCDSITQSFYVECSFKLKFLGVNILDGEKRKFTVTAERELRQWHNNDGTWKEGPCENMSHKVTFYVQEPIVENSDKGKVTVKYVPSIGAKLYLETPNDGEKPCIDTDGTHIKTDNEGKASLWVKATTLTDEDS